ncbi:MAG: hypothetical protein ABI870_01920 [Rhodanobacter sp.]
MSRRNLLGLWVMAGLLAACGRSPDNGFIGFGNSSLLNGGIHIRDGQATLHVHGSPDAIIDAAGDLTIDQHAVEVNPAERSLLQQYYLSALAVREHGIETGKAGAAIAGQALSSVAKGIATGDTDQIDKQVDAKADQVKQTALKICGDLAGIKAAQDGLAAQLAAFKPYAGIVESGAVEDCRKG